MRKPVVPLLLGLYGLFMAFSFIRSFGPGTGIGANFALFAVQMLRILPCAFVLIGLFEVWVRKETVVKHLGPDSPRLKAYLLVFLLAGTTVGGLYVAFPVAWALNRKGAGPQIVLGYIGAAAICRVPMTLFEVSFLGFEFSAVRLLVSLPLVVLTSELLGRYLTRKGWSVMDGNTENPSLRVTP